jgi:hypothetical protein
LFTLSCFGADEILLASQEIGRLKTNCRIFLKNSMMLSSSFRIIIELGR